MVWVADVLAADQITALAPGIPLAWVRLYADAIESVLAELAPTGVPESKLAQVKLLLASAVRRAGMARPWVESETTGPYAVKYRDAVDALFTASVLAELRALLGLSAASAGSRATFPSSDNLGSLFATRRSSIHAPGAEVERP